MVSLDAEVVSVNEALVEVESTVVTAEAEVVKDNEVSLVSKYRLSFVRSEEGKKDAEGQ